jgi:hypothetical protein
MLSFSWPAEGFKEEDFTLDFIYDLHGLVGIDGPNEFANMLAAHNLDLFSKFCDKWMEYYAVKYWQIKEQQAALV